MTEAEHARIRMMPVSFTNQLYGDEDAKRAARTDARFVNAAMKVTLLGGVTSDIASNGQVVSGIGVSSISSNRPLRSTGRGRSSRCLQHGPRRGGPRRISSGRIRMKACRALIVISW